MPEKLIVARSVYSDEIVCAAFPKVWNSQAGRFKWHCAYFVPSNDLDATKALDDALMTYYLFGWMDNEGALARLKREVMAALESVHALRAFFGRGHLSSGDEALQLLGKDTPEAAKSPQQD